MKALVVMPTYGRIPFLNRALASFLSQDYEDKELAIINDDINIELRCEQRNVVCINLNKRILTGQKKNLATNLGYHDLYLPFDDDDAMMPNRISNCINVHKNNPNIFLYANKSSYTIYNNKFMITVSGSNTISYTKQGWFKAGGYSHHSSCGEDQEFRNKVPNQLILDDLNLVDYVYVWSGLNYHATNDSCTTIEKMAYKQLKEMNLLNKHYTIEPDYSEYNKFLLLEKKFKLHNDPIPIKNISLGKIEVNE